MISNMTSSAMISVTNSFVIIMKSYWPRESYRSLVAIIGVLVRERTSFPIFI